MIAWMRGHWRAPAAAITVVLALGLGWFLNGQRTALDVEKARNDAQDQIDRQRTEQLEAIVQEIDADRLIAAEASCERGNEIRAGIRDLARDLHADQWTLAIVDQRFADVDCANAPGTNPATGDGP